MSLTYGRPTGCHSCMDSCRSLPAVGANWREIEVVEGGLAALVQAGILPHQEYDREAVGARRAAIRERMEIPWTAITPRMQRLLYAISTSRSRRSWWRLACSAASPTYRMPAPPSGRAQPVARRLTGIEIVSDEADRARHNVELFRNGDGRSRPKSWESTACPGSKAYDPRMDRPIDLLYLDANDPNRDHKSSISSSCRPRNTHTAARRSTDHSA